MPGESTLDSGRRENKDQGKSSVLYREPPWWVRDIVLALIIGGALLAIQTYLDSVAANRDERRENLRFVREHAGANAEPGHFVSIDLEDQNLSGLILDDADFFRANLAGANFDFANLRDGTSMSHADLTGASFAAAALPRVNLDWANATNAVFTGAVMVDVQLNGANVRGADFSGADLRGARLTALGLDHATLDDICWDDSTEWDDDFSPPPSEDGNCIRSYEPSG
jgi:uncharacterized protein YjbI with pentapeptide repeats